MVNEYRNPDIFLLEDLPPFMIGFSHGMRSMIPKKISGLKEAEKIYQKHENKPFYKTGNLMGKMVASGTYVTFATILGCATCDLLLGF